MKSIDLHSVQADEFNQNPVLETVKNSPVIPKTKLDYGTAVLTKDTQIKGDIKCLANWGGMGRFRAVTVARTVFFCGGEAEEGIKPLNDTLNHAKTQGDMLCSEKLEVLEKTSSLGACRGRRLS